MNLQKGFDDFYKKKNKIKLMKRKDAQPTFKELIQKYWGAKHVDRRG
jgi:hypothetical protein